MRKMMVLIIVLVVAAVAQGGISSIVNSGLPIENIAQIQTFDKTTFIKYENGSTYLVYNSADESSQQYDLCLLSGNNISIAEKGRLTTQCSLTDLLPKSSTIISLAIGGFLIRHKKIRIAAGLPLYI